MDCNVFEKKLPDLVEDNISYDIKEAMLKHIKECEECKKVYEQELEIDKVMKIGLSVEPHSFRSIRGDIMKNIDKNRYGRSPIKKILQHLNKYRVTYTSIAALVAVVVFITPYISKMNFSRSMNKVSSYKSSSKSSESIVSGAEVKDLSIDTPRAATKESAAANETSGKPSLYLPKFEKKEMPNDFKVSFGTPWVNSTDKQYSASIEGKGDKAQEEGIGTIIVKDLKTNTQYSFELVNNEVNQFSPLALEWINNEKLLIIVGSGHGSISHGGDLFTLDINKNETKKINAQEVIKLDQKVPITKILSVNINANKEMVIEFEYLVYEDSNYTKMHTEKASITTTVY
ncbi:hypothetical protein HMPREF1982_00308 [Clostridiales bacterium oral taxon 876 str. F0540]|nr:hypothetical protein HMPREF1982_00308 [Clostridiales bacterium oral taxon 876 str. F0540]